MDSTTLDPRIALDFDSAVPLHNQLSEAIRERIRSGVLRAGDQLPSEREFCESLGLSRGTVRQSLSALIAEGLVRTQRGRGNFVSTRKIEQALLSFPSLVLSLGKLDRSLKTIPLGVQIIPANLAASRALLVPEGSPVIEVRRLRALGGEPFLLTTSTVPEWLCPQLASDDHELRTVYELLEQKYSISIARVRSTLETMPLDEVGARLLSAHPSMPAFRLERTALGGEGNPLVYTVHIIRGDRCRFSFELSEQQPAVAVPKMAEVLVG